MKNINNASASASASSSLFALLFTILVIISSTNSTTPIAAEAVKEVKVGGKYGWSVPPTNDTDFYINWASKKRFHVGDSLRFEYRNDSVLVVDKWGYYHCNSTNPYYSFEDGNSTVVKLEKSGAMYFTSGEPDHCKDGQRLEVDVMDHRHHRPMAPTPPSSIQAPAPSPHSGASSIYSVLFFSEVLLFMLPLIATIV